MATEKFEPKNIKGAADFLPAVQLMRNKITDTLKRNFGAFGFLPLETAVLNYYDLLSYKYEQDAEILREVYRLSDQGERDLGLRFDLTVPFCKVIAMNRNLRLPFKRYEIGKVFRNGPVRLGRTREFYQCDVDAVGIAGPYIEAEFILLAVRCFTELGITPAVHIGDRRLLGALIADAGISKDKADAVIAILDKTGKVGEREILSEIEKHADKEGAKRLVGALKKSLLEMSKDFISNPAAAAALAGVRELWKTLDALDISKYCVFAPHLARGLNIYTGTVWEIFDGAGRITGAIAGGGRYDDIITNFIANGQSYPAVGMSFGLEPISAVLNIDDAGAGRSSVDLILIPLGTESASQSLAERLRAEGVKTLVHLGAGRVGKALDYANAEKIPYAAVIGENEIKNGEVTLKHMETGTQTAFSTKETKQMAIHILGGKK
jgi:histidyl-tRNA synthetase